MVEMRRLIKDFTRQVQTFGGDIHEWSRAEDFEDIEILLDSHDEDLNDGVGEKEAEDHAREPIQRNN